MYKTHYPSCVLAPDPVPIYLGILMSHVSATQGPKKIKYPQIYPVMRIVYYMNHPSLY